MTGSGDGERFAWTNKMAVRHARSEMRGRPPSADVV